MQGLHTFFLSNRTFTHDNDPHRMLKCKEQSRLAFGEGTRAPPPSLVSPVESQDTAGQLLEFSIQYPDNNIPTHGPSTLQLVKCFHTHYPASSSRSWAREALDPCLYSDHLASTVCGQFIVGRQCPCPSHPCVPQGLAQCLVYSRCLTVKEWRELCFAFLQNWLQCFKKQNKTLAASWMSM